MQSRSRLTTYNSRLPIKPSFRGDPNVQHITHIVPSIPSRAHLAALTIAPDDRHRADAIAVHPGDGQQLDVEGRHARSGDRQPTLSVKPGPEQQVTSDIGTKEFEPALRIV